MCRVDLTTGLIILLLALKRLNLGFCENQLFCCHLGFQGFQALLEVGQVMPQPDTAYATGRDEDTALAQAHWGPGLDRERAPPGRTG